MDIKQAAFDAVLSTLKQNHNEADAKLRANRREINKLADEQRILKKKRSHISDLIFMLTHKDKK
jgi:hypothetical protein